MDTYKCLVRVARSGCTVMMVVWAQVAAQSTIAAMSQLEALYGRGNVIAVTTMVTDSVLTPKIRNRLRCQVS